MQKGDPLIGRSLGQAHYCGAWELRITERCLTEDLKLPGDISIDEAADKQPIVSAFLKQRSNDPVGGADANWFGAAPRDGKSGYAWLRHRHHHRGITVYDEDRGVVWLVSASDKHQSGKSDPAQEHFRALAHAGKLAPTKSDYASQRRDEEIAIVERVLIQGRTMLDIARSEGGEVCDQLGGLVDTGVAVEIDAEIEAITFAFTVSSDEHLRLVELFLVAVFPDPDWENVFVMPSGRAIEYPEIGWRHHRER